MPADYEKHTTHTDALDTLGSIIGPTEKRDAIHLAVFPVQAGERLRAGDHVALGVDGCAVFVARGAGVGIVDPFLLESVAPGERFWLVVYPRQITSLRHVWEHAAFPPSGETGPDAAAVIEALHDKDASEAWLRNFCAISDCPGFEEVVGGACAGTDSWDDDYIHFQGQDAHGEIPPEFWDHLENYTGRTFPTRASYFSCSC